MIPETFFPKMPSEVREMWLNSIAEGHGWPFKSIQDSTEGTPWEYVFPGLTLRGLASLDWKEVVVDLSKKPLGHMSMAAIKGLYDQHVLGHSTIYENLDRTRERFDSCVSYIQTHGCIPAPVILRDMDSYYDLLDGNHRLAALRSEGFPQGYEVAAWVATEE